MRILDSFKPQTLLIGFNTTDTNTLAENILVSLYENAEYEQEVKVRRDTQDRIMYMESTKYRYLPLSLSNQENAFIGKEPSQIVYSDHAKKLVEIVLTIEGLREDGNDN